MTASRFGSASQHSIVEVAEDAATARDRLARVLDGYRFHPGLSAPEQTTLQGEYLAWATQVLESREAAYGSHAPYELGRDMKTEQEIARPLFDAVRKFLSSASRSPVAGALASVLAPQPGSGSEIFSGAGEFSNTYDPTVIGGAAGGVSAYFMESTVLTAMDRVAKQANLASIKSIPTAALFPDPCSVRLELVKEGDVTIKVFTRVDGAAVHAPHDEESGHTTGSTETGNSPEKSLESSRALTAERRLSVGRWQRLLNGEAESTFLQPTLTGLANVGRRLALSERDILEPLPVLGASALASGAAGAVGRLILGGAKAIPWMAQTTVDDLVGGKQRVNLFVAKPPNANERSVRFSDIMKVPGYLVPVLRETGALLGHTFGVRGRSWTDLGFQAADIIGKGMANMFSSAFSVSVGGTVAQLLRGGRLTADATESSKAPAALVQQFVQSSASDAIWDSTKLWFATGYDLSESLDRRRKERQEGLENRREQLRQQALRVMPQPPSEGDPSQPLVERMQTLLTDRRRPIDTLECRQLAGELLTRAGDDGALGEGDNELRRCLGELARVQGEINGIERARHLKRD